MKDEKKSKQQLIRELEQLRRRNRELEKTEAGASAAIAGLSRALLSPMSIEDISYSVFEQARKLTGSRFGFVGYIDPETGHMVSSTLTRDIWDDCRVKDKDIVFKEFRGLWGWVLESKKPLLTNSPSTDPRSSGTPEGHIPIRRFLSAPALIGETLVGQVSVANSERDYNDRDLDLIERLATIFALAVRRKRMDEELRRARKAVLEESEGRFRLISEQSLLAIIIIQDEVVKYANQAYSDLTGYSNEELLNWKPLEYVKMIHPDDLILVLGEVKEEIENKAGAIRYQERLITKQGQLKWIDTYSRAIVYEGRPAYMATIIDITEKKEAEEQAARQQKQLIQADKLASLGVLVAGVAHEINNPNQAIMLSGQILKKAWEDMKLILEAYYRENGDFLLGGINYSRMRDAVADYLSGILESAGRINAIVSDLKEFSRQDSPKLDNIVNLNVVVNSALTLVSNMIKNSTRNFKMELTPDLPVVKGNFQRLEQVVINLLQNACQALPNVERSIFVATRYDKKNREIILEIRDEGVGIPPESILKIKDPFFTTRRDTGGSGLGLSVSSAIIEEHGGSLNYFSKPGQGTRAIVTLPLKYSRAEG
ncbi:MAG TPA: PAS domain S-box protein [Spirochaetales bacterium]|nr:PAS domain S-box protein [Spirochaetales bacterium]